MTKCIHLTPGDWSFNDDRTVLQGIVHACLSDPLTLRANTPIGVECS